MDIRDEVRKLTQAGQYHLIPDGKDDYSPERTDWDNLVLLAERLERWSYRRLINYPDSRAEGSHSAYSEMLSHITRYRDANR